MLMPEYFSQILISLLGEAIEKKKSPLGLDW